MRKTMQWVPKALAIAAMAGLLASFAPSTFAQQRRVVIIQSVPVIDPFYAYPYAYPYYLSFHYGYVKVKTHHRNANLYVDGGYADRIENSKKFALRPGDHDIELRNPDGSAIFKERVAVILGETTKIDLPQTG
jgi:hypothetical protein